MERKNCYYVVLSTKNRMTLSWLILIGKQRCSHKIRKMRVMGTGNFDRCEMERWVHKLNDIKELEQVLGEML